MEAKGGVACGYVGTGGGGAVAVEYGGSSGSVLSQLVVRGGEQGAKKGGAGTVYLKGPSGVYGDLLVDNGGVEGEVTELPALGGGVVQGGSGGGVLVTGLGGVPGYFVGHWVEVRDGVGQLKGRWQVGSIAGGVLSLEANGAFGAPNVAVGDRWQGVYLFDRVVVRDRGKLRSLDPVVSGGAVLGGGGEAVVLEPLRASGAVEVVGPVAARRLEVGSLVVRSGGVLSQPLPAAGGGVERLEVEVAGDVTVESGGAIDVSGRGYAGGASYPGATLPGAGSGGSHLGVGGVKTGPGGGTFGSVVRPQEAGGGGQGTG